MENEIDLLDLFYFLKKRVPIIIASFLVFAIVGAAVTVFGMETRYTANTRIYVLNRSSETNVSYSDFQVSNQLLDDYVVLITGENVTKEVVAEMGLDMSYKALAGMISVTAPSDTRVIQISVTDTDAQRAADIANTVREIASVQIKEIMDVDAVNLVYEADVPQEKSGPSLKKNTAIAALVGLMASVVVLVVIYMMDDTIRTEEDVQKHLGLSVLGVIPVSKGMEAYGNGSKSQEKVERKSKLNPLQQKPNGRK